MNKFKKTLRIAYIKYRLLRRKGFRCMLQLIGDLLLFIASTIKSEELFWKWTNMCISYSTYCYYMFNYKLK